MRRGDCVLSARALSYQPSTKQIALMFMGRFREISDDGVFIIPLPWKVFIPAAVFVYPGEAWSVLSTIGGAIFGLLKAVSFFSWSAFLDSTGFIGDSVKSSSSFLSNHYSGIGWAVLGVVVFTFVFKILISDMTKGLYTRMKDKACIRLKSI